MQASTHTAHRTSTAECTCWGGRASLGTEGHRQGRAPTRGFAYISDATQPLRGQFPGEGTAGPMDLSCQSPPGGKGHNTVPLSPVGKRSEVTDRLGWDGHQLPPNSRTLQYRSNTPATAYAICPWLLRMGCWGLARRVEGRGSRLQP